MIVKDIEAKSVTFSKHCMTKKTKNFRIYDSPGNAKTLIMRGGIANHYSIACCLSDISAKSYQNRLMCVEVIVCYISVVFFQTQCSLNIRNVQLYVFNLQCDTA